MEKMISQILLIGLFQA